MLDDVVKFMEAAIGKLTPAKAQELARSLVQGQGKDQVARRAQELMEWSQRNRDRLKDLVQREVKAQLKALGVASRDDLEALRKRVRELEKASRGAAAKKSPAKKPRTKKAPAKRAAATKSAAGKSAERPSSPRT